MPLPATWVTLTMGFLLAVKLALRWVVISDFDYCSWGLGDAGYSIVGVASDFSLFPMIGLTLIAGGLML